MADQEGRNVEALYAGLLPRRAEKAARKSRKGKKPWYNLKESQDRKALVSYVVQTGYIALAIGWKIYAGSYLGKGINTGDWNPFRFDSKDKLEQKIQEKEVKEEDLEKIINYQDILE